MLVPDPRHRLFAALHAAPFVGVCNGLVALGRGGGVVPFGPAGAEHEDVAGEEGEVGVAGYGFEVGDSDGVGGHGRVGGIVAGGVGDVVEEDATTNDAASLRPVCLRQRHFGSLHGSLTLHAKMSTLGHLLVFMTVVIKASSLMTPMSCFCKPLFMYNVSIDLLRPSH